MIVFKLNFNVWKSLQFFPQVEPVVFICCRAIVRFFLCFFFLYLIITTCLASMQGAIVRTCNGIKYLPHPHRKHKKKI